jgi:hypothetical protein
VPGQFSRRRSCKRKGVCICLHRRRFPNSATMHGNSTPVVAHGILEVAEEQARPAAILSDARQLSARVSRFHFSECKLWMELKSNPRHTLHA